MNFHVLEFEICALELILCIYLHESYLWLIMTSAILGSRLSPWFCLGDLCDLVILWSLVAIMTPHCNSSQTLLDLCDLYFSWPYLSTCLYNWTLCESALDLPLQLISVWECLRPVTGFYFCVIYYGHTSRSVPAIYLSVSPYGFYLCVLDSFPWVWTVYLSSWLSREFWLC